MSAEPDGSVPIPSMLTLSGVATAAEFVRLAARAVVDAGPAAIGASDRLAPLIERTFHYSYMMATRMRDEMLAGDRDDEVEALVRPARALQDELTGGPAAD